MHLRSPLPLPLAADFRLYPPSVLPYDPPVDSLPLSLLSSCVEADMASSEWDSAQTPGLNGSDTTLARRAGLPDARSMVLWENHCAISRSEKEFEGGCKKIKELCRLGSRQQVFEKGFGTGKRHGRWGCFPARVRLRPLDSASLLASRW